MTGDDVALHFAGAGIDRGRAQAQASGHGQRPGVQSLAPGQTAGDAHGAERGRRRTPDDLHRQLGDLLVQLRADQLEHGRRDRVVRPWPARGQDGQFQLLEGFQVDGQAGQAGAQARLDIRPGLVQRLGGAAKSTTHQGGRGVVGAR
ncbi:hypothetical protein ASD38_19735 [Caulobacter sp. Root487D2Y]|nr:hypothetical protein ASD38_19735 [Caulobacter sp. Root487D2Y]